MPSPVGHALAGLAVHVALSRAPFEMWDARRAGLTVAAALAPDLDLLLRFLDGRNHHQAESHSLGCALLAALVVAVLGRMRGTTEWRRPASAAGLAWLSHLALDYLSRDANPPVGIMAFWPLSDAYYKFAWPIFLDIGRTLEWATIRNNALAAAWETLLLLPLLVVAVRARFRAGD